MKVKLRAGVDIYQFKCFGLSWTLYPNLIAMVDVCWTLGLIGAKVLSIRAESEHSMLKPFLIKLLGFSEIIKRQQKPIINLFNYIYI